MHLTILSGSGWIVDSPTRLHIWSPAYTQIRVRDDGPPSTLHHTPRSHACSPARTSPGVTHGQTSRTPTQPFKRTLSRMPSAYNCVWSKNAR